jgi:hypothetical protein
LGVELLELAHDMKGQGAALERGRSAEARRGPSPPPGPHRPLELHARWHCGGACFRRAEHHEGALKGLGAGEGEVANGTAPEDGWLASAMTDPDGYGEVPPASIGRSCRASNGL